MEIGFGIVAIFMSLGMFVSEKMAPLRASDEGTADYYEDPQPEQIFERQEDEADEVLLAVSEEWIAEEEDFAASGMEQAVLEAKAVKAESVFVRADAALVKSADETREDSEIGAREIASVESVLPGLSEELIEEAKSVFWTAFRLVFGCGRPEAFGKLYDGYDDESIPVKGSALSCASAIRNYSAFMKAAC